MRFMMIVKATPESEASRPPSPELVAAMGRYNDELMKAGVLLDLGGLKSSEFGARVKFEGSKRSVIDGPFAESKELIAGFWILQVKSKEEAIEWAKRAPCDLDDGQIAYLDLLQFHDMDAFASDAI